MFVELERNRHVYDCIMEIADVGKLANLEKFKFLTTKTLEEILDTEILEAHMPTDPAI